MLETLSSYLKQFVIVFPWHTDIHIVIPRNESFVSDSTKQGAAIYPNSKFMFLANIKQLYK